MKKAKIFELICDKAELYINDRNAFQHKMAGEGILGELRSELENEVKNREIPQLCEKTERAWQVYGAYVGLSDYGHTSPNTRLLVRVGFRGLIEKIEAAESKDGLTQKARDLYSASKIMLHAMIKAAKRLSFAIKESDKENL